MFCYDAGSYGDDYDYDNDDDDDDDDDDGDDDDDDAPQHPLHGPIIIQHVIEHDLS